jgi:ankyrin repeat protein
VIKIFDFILFSFFPIDGNFSVDTPRSDGWGPLHTAASNGHVNLIHLLCDHGANINAQSSQGHVRIDLFKIIILIFDMLNLNILLPN